MIRSLLYVPANRPERVDKAFATAADAVILDLEDAVPNSEKENARKLAAERLATGSQGKPVFVRINAGEAGLADIDLIARAGCPDTILVPKAEDRDGVARIAMMLDKAGSATTLQPIIESAKGLDRLGEIATASSRVVRFSFGAGDFVADIGARHTPERSETFLARSMLVLQSRLLKLRAPAAHVIAAFKDEAALRRACVEDRALGFAARSCIHPVQIDIVNESFGATHAEIARARRIIDVAEAQAADGIGAFVLEDGTFVDEAVVREARLLVGEKI